jgi:hypothetical protein
MLYRCQAGLAASLTKVSQLTRGLRCTGNITIGGRREPSRADATGARSGIRRAIGLGMQSARNERCSGSVIAALRESGLLGHGEVQVLRWNGHKWEMASKWKR